MSSAQEMSTPDSFSGWIFSLDPSVRSYVFQLIFLSVLLAISAMVCLVTLSVIRYLSNIFDDNVIQRARNKFLNFAIYTVPLLGLGLLGLYHTEFGKEDLDEEDQAMLTWLYPFVLAASNGGIMFGLYFLTEPARETII